MASPKQLVIDTGGHMWPRSGDCLNITEQNATPWHMG
jgi:hypothetical protein